MRIDQYLVEKKYFESRSKAQAAIAEGLVRVNGEIIRKPSFEITEKQTVSVEVQQGAVQKYVSRGGQKLKGALDYLQLSVCDKTILDVGVSTGGFSDCLLQEGAACVVGIDVGHGQLHEKLSKIMHLHVFEKTHIKDLTRKFLLDHKVPDQFDLVVVDVSFISLKNIMFDVLKFLKPQAQALCLVKPQFELESKVLNKKGVVKDSSHYGRLEIEIKFFFESQGCRVLNYFESAIQGGDGNREFFIYAEKI